MCVESDWFTGRCTRTEIWCNLVAETKKCKLYNVHVIDGDDIKDSVYDNKKINGDEVSGQKVHGESASTTYTEGGAYN
ncbi:MAG: hypothetical protein K2H53_03650, partial [Clostridia bacterium]|nr:hypothetical protein [Clostridia bacterium]